MIVRGAFNHLLRPGVRKDFRDSYESYPEEFGMFMRVENLDRAEEERVAISGLGRMVVKTEVGQITYIDPVQSPKYTFTYDEFSLGFMISERMLRDDLYGRANQSAKWLGRAARLTQEYLAATVLDDAFDGTVYTGLLGEKLIDDDHALLNGSGTWSNEVAGNPALSVTSYQAALELAGRQVDHQGDPMPMVPNRLIIDTTDEWMAIQLTQNPNEPFTANNTLNASLRKSGIRDYKVSHYKEQDGSWFLQDTRLHELFFKFRVRPQMGDAYDGGSTNASKYWCLQAIMAYFFDQRGIIGSDGTGV